MLKEKFKRFIPSASQIKSYKSLQIFGDFIHDPNLWHLNRLSVCRAMAVGLFFAWVPVPFQMVLAAGGAILVHSNLAISVALVWITNPLTMPALYFFAYKLGRIILSAPPRPFVFELSWNWLLTTLTEIWRPFLLGCFILGVISAVVGYFGTQALWRYMTVRSWTKRQKNRNHKENAR